jgi:hypothetical protein
MSLARDPCRLQMRIVRRRELGRCSDFGNWEGKRVKRAIIVSQETRHIAQLAKVLRQAKSAW